ncbi:MAG: hypothetical protein ACRDF4_08545, partial [Rhabdochlamydiaceae bacterium]
MTKGNTEFVLLRPRLEGLLLHVGTDRGATEAFGLKSKRGNGLVFAKQEAINCPELFKLPLYNFEFRYGNELEHSSESVHKDPDFENFTYGEPRIGG